MNTFVMLSSWRLIIAILLISLPSSLQSFVPNHLIEVSDVVMNKSQNLTFFIVLHHRNIDKLKRHFLAVSDPTHVNYGKYLTLHEIQRKYGALLTTKLKIINYLKSIFTIMDVKYDVHDIMTVTTHIEQIEKQFQTKLSFYRYKNIPIQTSSTKVNSTTSHLNTETSTSTSSGDGGKNIGMNDNSTGTANTDSNHSTTQSHTQFDPKLHRYLFIRANTHIKFPNDISKYVSFTSLNAPMHVSHHVYQLLCFMPIH